MQSLPGYAPDAPAYDFVADDGIRHQLWVIQDQQTIAAITRRSGRSRRSMSPTAITVPQLPHGWEKNWPMQIPDHRGDEEYNFFLAVLFPHNQLRIMDYNRVVKDLNGKSGGAVPDRHPERL